MNNQVNQSFDTQTQRSQNTPSNNATTLAFGLTCSIVGVMGGFISMFLAYAVSKMDTGSRELNRAYGGDAFTGIQNATAQTANNIQDLAEIIKTGISYALIVFGIAMIAYFGIKLFKIIEKLSANSSVAEERPQTNKQTDNQTAKATKAYPTNSQQPHPNKGSTVHSKVESKMLDSPTTIYCPFCGEELYIDRRIDTMECPYCTRKFDL